MPQINENEVYTPKETQELLKIDELRKKMEQLSEEMSRPDFWNDQKTAQNISQDYQDIRSEVEKWGAKDEKHR